MIVVSHAPAYLTVQDMGRQGYLAAGVPRGGAMDRWSLAALNCLLGNARGAAGLEWALTGGAIEFHGAATIALGGADAECSLGGAAVEPYRAVSVKRSDTLVVERIARGRFLYIAVATGIACESVLGSRSTYIAGGFGGIDGRRLKSGDTLHTGAARSRSRRHQVMDQLPQRLRFKPRNESIRVVTRSFVPDDVAGGWEIQPYTVSAASDRTGYRLEGTPSADGASATSEPVCPGAIQLPPEGVPIVLMADAPTIGGYRILGSVVSADLGSLAQKLPGDIVHFEPISVRTAQAELRRCDDILFAITDWAG